MKFRSIKTALDVGASVACVLICVYLIIGFVGRNWQSRQRQVIAGLQVGAKFPTIAGVDFGQHSGTVLLFLSDSCSHCINSLPVYQSLFDKLRASGNSSIGFFGLFQNEASRERIAMLGFKPPSRANIPFANYNVRATPTVVFINREGRVQNFWVGELSDGALLALTQLIDSHT